MSLVEKHIIVSLKQTTSDFLYDVHMLYTLAASIKQFRHFVAQDFSVIVKRESFQRQQNLFRVSDNAIIESCSVIYSITCFCKLQIPVVFSFKILQLLEWTN